MLRRPISRSARSSFRWREKNDPFEAVMGVVGVFAMTRDGGGLRPRSGVEAIWSCRAAIFAVVGLLRGCRFMGGRRSGWRFFLLLLLVIETPVTVWFILSESLAACKLVLR